MEQDEVLQNRIFKNNEQKFYQQIRKNEENWTTGYKRFKTFLGQTMGTVTT